MGDVNIATDEHVAVITLPEVMTGESAFDLRDACLHVRRDVETWVVVLVVSVFSGAGRNDVPELDAGTLEGKRIADSVAAIEKPVVAAVLGDATDQVLELALACDVRIASDASRFGLTQKGTAWFHGTEARSVCRGWSEEAGHGDGPIGSRAGCPGST